MNTRNNCAIMLLGIVLGLILGVCASMVFGNYIYVAICLVLGAIAGYIMSKSNNVIIPDKKAPAKTAAKKTTTKKASTTKTATKKAPAKTTAKKTTTKKTTKK